MIGLYSILKIDLSAFSSYLSVWDILSLQIQMEVRRETEDEAQNCLWPLLLLQICSNLYLHYPSHAHAHILQLQCKEIEEIVRSLHSCTVHTHV